MLLYKLLLNNIDGKVYHSVKSIYASTSSCIRINNKLTDWFDCSIGVKQGCTLSPTLFSIFANDLVHEVNALDIGISMGDTKISMLMYADDIVMVADSELKLQTMLNTLHEWCKRWRVLINANKSKCVHFRHSRTVRSDFVFRVGENVIETVDHYKYLGVIFHEKNDFSLNCDALSKGAGRALGGIISKIHSLKGFGFRAYEKLYNSCVVPIQDYCASVWGYKAFQCLENVQLRALRYFLGVHRFAPTLSLYGDTAWLPNVYRRWGCMLRFWNRLINMPENRLTKRVFNYDYRLCKNNWCSELKLVLSSIGQVHYFDSKTVINLSSCRDSIREYYTNKWSDNVHASPKLRTYRVFKQDFKCEDYVTMNLKKCERSLLTQFRCGILPLRIETGRYVGELPEQRVCKYCSLQSVEDELHFILECELYSDIRSHVIGEIINGCRNQPANQKLSILMNIYPRKSAKFISNAYHKRRQTMFSH